MEVNLTFFVWFCLDGSPTLRAQGDVGVNPVSSVWACVGLCGGACTLASIHLCVILWTERSRTAASAGDGGHSVLKVPTSHPSVLWRSGVAHVVSCLAQPETPYFFRYPVEMQKE